MTSPQFSVVANESKILFALFRNDNHRTRREQADCVCVLALLRLRTVPIIMTVIIYCSKRRTLPAEARAREDFSHVH